MIPPTSIDGTDITGATIDNQEVQEITVDGDVVFSAGPEPGTHFYFGNKNADELQHFVCSTPYDLSTISLTSSINSNFPKHTLSPDGTRLWLSDDDSTTVEQYDLPTPYNLNGATNRVDFTGFAGGFDITHDFAQGGTVFIRGDTLSNGYEDYTLSTPFDLSTRTKRNSFVQLPQSQGRQGAGFVFNADGTRVIYGEINQTEVFQSTLSTPFDFSTATFDKSFTPNTQDPGFLAISNDGNTLFVQHFTPTETAVYDLASPFDIGNPTLTGTFTPQGATTAVQISFNGKPHQV